MKHHFTHRFLLKVTISLLSITTAMPSMKAQVTEYSWDSNTILLDHFNYSVNGSVYGTYNNGSICSPLPTSAPNYNFEPGPQGLDQALIMYPPSAPSGSVSYVKYDEYDMLSIPNGTVEFWLRIPSYFEMSLPLIQQGLYYNACEGWTFDISLNPGGVISCSASGAFDLNSGSTIVSLNTWTHIAVSWGSGGAKLYINGDLKASIPNTGYPLSGYGGKIMVPLATQYISGSGIDELRISNIARSPEDFNLVYVPVPEISFFGPVSGPIGTIVTITGNNFNPTPTNNIVRFGGVKATVNSSSINQLHVVAPAGATYLPISITDITTGRTTYSKSPFNQTFSSSAAIDAGSFATMVGFNTGTNPYQVAIGDLDGDGKPDMAISNNGSGNVSVIRNTSTSGAIASGSFSAPVNYSTGSWPECIALGDIDGNGKQDIVVTNNNNFSFSVLRNISTPGFIGISSFSKSTFTASSYPEGIAIGDLDNDGKLDIVMTHPNSNKISIFKNTSVPESVSFAASVDINTNAYPNRVIIGDIDGNGKQDIAVACTNSNMISVFRNIGTTGSISTGSFAASVNLITGSGPWDLAFGDIDGDLKEDLAVTNKSGNTISVFRNLSALNVISFSPKIDFPAEIYNPYDISIGDINGDGKPDIAITYLNGSYVSVYKNKATSGSINVNSLASMISYNSGTASVGLEITDLDLDNKPDIAATRYSSGQIAVIRNIILPPSAPVISTNSLTAVKSNTATCGGNITADGGSAVTSRGICWNTSDNPTINNSKTSNGTGTGEFTSYMNGLIPGTVYFVRAYASNTYGVSYGSEYRFTSAVAGAVLMDADSNLYTQVSLGTQVWMAENLKTTRYNNNDPVTTTSPSTLDITGITNPKYQWPYGGDENNAQSFGRLYTWFAAVDSRNICPEGWHLPSDTEFGVLTNYLTNAGFGYQGSGNDIAKSMASKTGWTADATSGNVGNDQASNNSSGLNGRPGGIRMNSGTFSSIESQSTWWNSNEANTDYAWYKGLYSTLSFVSGGSTFKAHGLYVRCLRNLLQEPPVLSTLNVSSITTTTASSGGIISSDKGSPVTARGICWSTSTGPTIANSKTNESSGTGTFTSLLSGLSSGTKYYVRAYATNGGGTAYGNEVSFTTNVGTTLPTVTTAAISDITYNTAKGGGNVTNLGNGTVTAKGICWNTSSNPTLSNNFTNDAIGLGSFTSNLSSLTPGTTYYVRAYATNEAGTAYGSEVSFSTIALSQIVINVNMIESGIAAGEKVYISGILGGIYGTWDQPGLNPNNEMHDPENDGIYSITLNLPDGLITYKFYIGANWLNEDPGGEKTHTVNGNANLNYYWAVPGVPVSSLVINTTSGSNKIDTDNGTLQMNVTVLPADASNKWIIWYTQSVTGKAHISPSGLVTAIQDGIVIITGVSCDGTNTSDTMAITLSNQVSVDYPIVFETNADTFWSSFANGPYTPDDLTRVSNPDKTGINTSDKVLKFVVNETAERWVGGFSDVYTPITFTDSLNSITMMVYKTVISPTMLKVENSTNGGPVIEVFESNTLINEWELLTFRFPAGIGYTYPCIVVFPDFPEVRTSGTTVYIDNISGPVYTPPYDAPTAVINKAAAGPIIDGTIDAIWSSANTYNIDKPYGLEAPTLGGSGTSWSGLWTEDGIYVLVQVNDDVFFPAYAGANPESSWMYDKPEIWFDVNQILDDGIGPESGNGHYSISPDFIETMISGEPITWDDGTSYAYMVNNPGYIAEYFIPFARLIDKDGFIVPKTATFGFDVTIIDRDIETITRQRAVWSNIGDIDESWINMDDCGTVTLAGADPGILVTDLLISSAGGSTVINTDGGTLQMSAATLPLNATNPEVSWSVSSITGKASINSSGLLTAELSGTVLVTARTTDGSYISSSMEINITNQVMNTAEAANMVYSLIGDGFYLADGVTLASWNYDKDLTYIGTDGNKSTYQLSAQELLTNGMFKIRKDHQWAESYGYDEVTIIGDPTNFVKQEVNIKTINGKTYDIIFIVDWATGDLILSLNPLPPSVITSPVTSVSSGSAVCGGEVISDSGTPVTSRGICWSTNKNPTIANSHTTNGTGKGVFISNITGLNHVTTYYVRAYATNSIGTSYGEELSFHTLSKDATVTSTAFSVDQDALTITGISILENLTSFKGKIVPATGASFEVYKSNGTTVATDLQSGYLLISKAEDGLTTLTYILTVNSGISSEANFISYSISGVNGTINTIAKTISVNLPFGTNVSSLTATFSLSAGASAKVGGIAQISGISTNNFVSPVTYIVTAEDGITAKSWTVSITLESGSSDATVSSTEYAIDNTTKTISNIRTTETLEVFKGLLIPAAGASFQVYQSDGVSLATDLQTGYKVIVIAENGITSNTYTLTVSVTSVASPDATICSGSSTSISLTGYSGTIQWQQSVDGLSAWTNVSGGTGGTSDNYTTANLSSTTFFRAEITSAGSVVSYSNIVKITVEQTPANSGVITGNSLVCPGQKAVTYEVQPINFATSYIWSLPAGMTGISTTNAIEVDIDPSFISGGIEVYGQNSCYSGGASIFVVNVTQMVADAGAISGPTAVCQGEDSVEYSVPEIANASSYIWTLPTGVTGTSLTNKISVNFGSTAVSGNISVKGNNSCGDGAKSSLTITVSPLPSPASSISGSTTVCQGQNLVQYAVPTISNAASYVWTLPEGATGTSSTNIISVNFGFTADSGNIIWKGHNQCGDGPEGALFIVVNPIPGIAGTIEGPDTICIDQDEVVYKVPAIDYAASYLWTLPTGATGTSTADSIIVNFSSSFVSGNISVLGQNNCGQGASSSFNINVRPKPADAGAISGPDAVCKGELATFTVPSIANATSYVWTLPSGVTGNSSSNSIEASFSASSSSDIIEVSGKNECYTGGSSIVLVTVNTVPSNAGSISGPTVVCPGTNSQNYAIPTIQNATSYVWTLPSGATGTSTTKVISVNYGSSAVTGEITVKGRNSCDGLASSLNVTVSQPFAEEEVCVVTIDEETGKNLVVWEKTYDVNTESYNVYRESNTGGVYTLLANIPFDSLTVYTDMTSEPESKSQKYYITTIDNCGNESAPSRWHRPMLLTSSVGTGESTVNLAWTEYQQESGETGSLLFTSYIIYRSTSKTKLVPLDTIPSDNTLYPDNKAPKGVNLYYRIAGLKSEPCDPADLLNGKKASSGPFVHSLSNLEDNRLQLTGINNPLSEAIQLAVYPNPFTNQSTISYYLDKPSMLKIEIYNIVGEKVKVLLDENQSPGYYNLELNASDVNYYPGVYYLKIHVNESLIIRKTMLSR